MLCHFLAFFLHLLPTPITSETMLPLGAEVCAGDGSSGTALLPCSSSEQAASCFEMSFAGSRNGNAGDLVLTEVDKRNPLGTF